MVPLTATRQGHHADQPEIKDLIYNAGPTARRACSRPRAGRPNISPKGSMLVFDDEHLAIGSARRTGAGKPRQRSAGRGDLRQLQAQRDGVLESGFLRFYGSAELYESGPTREAIFQRLTKREQEHDGADKGIGVLIKIARAADVRGKPLP